MGDIVSGIFGGGGGGSAPQQQQAPQQVQKPDSPLLNSLMSSALAQNGQQQQMQQPAQNPFAQQLMQLQIQPLPAVGTPDATNLASNIAGQVIGRWGQQQRMWGNQ